MNKYIVEHGLEKRVKHAVDYCNTIEDLSEYLATDPHPDYRLVSVLWLKGTYTIIWEYKK